MDTTTKSPRAIQKHILALLADLPSDKLVFVEQFVEFLRQQPPPVPLAVQEERAPYLYPTVPVPASHLDGLVGIMPPVGGDALTDSEALYDET